MNPNATIKRGDTLSWGCTYTTSEGEAISLAGYTIASQIREPGGELLATLTIANRTDSEGTFDLAATAAATSAWTPGLYLCDVELTSPESDVTSTETFAVRVVADITRT